MCHAEGRPRRPETSQTFDPRPFPLLRSPRRLAFEEVTMQIPWPSWPDENDWEYQSRLTALNSLRAGGTRISQPPILYQEKVHLLIACSWDTPS